MRDVTCCPICLSNKISNLTEPKIHANFSSFIRKDYSSCFCNECKYFFVYPSIDFTSDEWSTMYSAGYFSGYMTKWWTNKRAKERKRVFNFFTQNSGNDKKNFLEIGCGKGYVLIDAQKMNWKVTGIDVYDNRIIEAKTHTVNFLTGDLPKQNFASGAFNYIYIDSVLEHVPDPINYINEINRVLKMGGMLYLAVPNESALIFKFRNLIFKLLGNKFKSNSFQPFQHPYHINGFTRSSLIRLLENNNFSIIKYRNYAGWYEFLKYKFLSKGFIKNALLLPVHILAVFLRMEYYQDVICKKVGEIKEDEYNSDYSRVSATN